MRIHELPTHWNSQCLPWINLTTKDKKSTNSNSNKRAWISNYSNETKWNQRKKRKIYIRYFVIFSLFCVYSFILFFFRAFKFLELFIKEVGSCIFCNHANTHFEPLGGNPGIVIVRMVLKVFIYYFSFLFWIFFCWILHLIYFM